MASVTLTIRQIRATVVDALGDALGALTPPWHLSRHGFRGMERAARDGADIAHLSYAVATPSTVLHAGRQRRDVPVHTGTALHVRWLYFLRPEDLDESYADALDAEALLLRAVLAVHDGLQVQVTDGATRREIDVGGTWVLGEIRFVVHHPHGLAEGV